jgi:hypothetical protein
MTAAFEAIGTVASQQGTISTPGTATFVGSSAQIPSGSGTGFLAVIFWGNAGDDPVIYDDTTWTFRGDVGGGAGSWGIDDSGTRHISVYWTEDNITAITQEFTNGGGNDTGNMILGYIIRCTKTLTHWHMPEVAGGSDDTAGAPFAATLNRDPGGEVGDLAIWATIANTDGVNPAGLTLTWPDVIGTSTATVTTPSTAGHDSRVNIRRTPITSGGSTGDVPSISSSTTFTGAALLARVRDSNTAPVSAPVAITDGDAVVEPWLEFDLDGSASSYQPGATFAWTDETVGGTGTVVIDDDTALVTTAHVDPNGLTDEDYTFQLEITDAGGSDTATAVKTVLRSATFTRIGGTDTPMRRITE